LQLFLPKLSPARHAGDIYEWIEPPQALPWGLQCVIDVLQGGQFAMTPWVHRFAIFPLDFQWWAGYFFSW